MELINLIASIVVSTNLGYVTAYDDVRLQPAWVQYTLESNKVVLARRHDFKFRPDPRFPGSDATADYAHSGYDRGHMAPAADFNWSLDALRETYYFSNVCPQAPDLNRGTWREIELEVRNLAKHGKVNILTAPYGWTSNRCGRLPVPAQFIKVVWGEFGFKLYLEDNK